MKCHHCGGRIWPYQKPFELTNSKKIHNQCVGAFMRKELNLRQQRPSEVLEDITFIKYDIEVDDYTDIHQRKGYEI